MSFDCDDYPNNLYKIEELYLFISEDEKGEGVCSFQLMLNGERTMLTMVCADKDRLNSLMPYAKSIARESRKKIKLIKFTNREEIQEIES